MQHCTNLNRMHVSVGKALRTANQGRVTRVTANSHALSCIFVKSGLYSSFSCVVCSAGVIRPTAKILAIVTINTKIIEAPVTIHGNYLSTVRYIHDKSLKIKPHSEYYLH